MAWYNFWRDSTDIEEKLNPGQILDTGKSESSREFTQAYERFYEQLEVVNRGVNMIVDDSAEIRSSISPQGAFKGVVTGVKRGKVEELLNRSPNPFQDVNSFKRNLITDYLIDGNIFVYYDGAHLYHLPADKVRVLADSSTYVEKYTLQDIDYKVNEIIHVKENSFHSIYRGVSRLKSATRSMQLVKDMREFQDNFFRNGAVPGLVLKSPNTLS